MGGGAILAEILSEEDQATVVEVMIAAETEFAEAEFSYWWSGLRDDNDDGEWLWVECK